jgi:hypothetical protein
MVKILRRCSVVKTFKAVFPEIAFLLDPTCRKISQNRLGRITCLLTSPCENRNRYKIRIYALTANLNSRYSNYCSQHPNIPHQVPGTQPPGTQHPASRPPSFRLRTPDTRHWTSNTGHPTPGIRHRTPDTGHPTPDSRLQIVE